MKLPKNSLITPGHFTVYGIAVTLAIAAFFVQPLENGFREIGNYLDFGFSLKNTLLFISNLIIALSIDGIAYNDDERIEKIKNHLRSYLLWSVILSMATIGLLSSLHSIILIWLIILQIQYITLYWICVYMDPDIIYMDPEQRKALNASMNKGFKLQYIPIIILVIGTRFVRDHQRELLSLFFLAYLNFFSFAKTLYIHLKRSI